MSETFRQALSDAMPRAYVVAYRRLGDRDAAQEVCQEAATRALRARDRFDTTRPFYPWFYRIVQNVCRDTIRGIQGKGPHLAEPVVDPHPGVESNLIESERDAAVLRAVADLPNELREIIELRHFQDLSYRELAEVLGLPNGTVMSRLYRARRALSERLQTEGSAV